jgi:hypothetical protein
MTLFLVQMDPGNRFVCEPFCMEEIMIQLELLQELGLEVFMDFKEFQNATQKN